jgi:rsbT co-antagonist protein RsbR
MQQIKDVDARLKRLTETLAHLLEGEFAKIDAYSEVEDDPLGRIEETVQSLVMDIKTVSSANAEKEACLLMQQGELAAKSELLEVQRKSIEQHEQELRVKAETIERQAVAIRELSTPVLEVWDDVLVLPVIGTVDTHRSERIMSNLLDSIVEKRTQWVIIDITGVEVVDTRTADHLIKMVRAAGLLGTSCLLCGLQPAVAQTLVGVGVELTEIVTERNLKQALAHCVRQMHRAVQG